MSSAICLLWSPPAPAPPDWDGLAVCERRRTRVSVHVPRQDIETGGEGEQRGRIKYIVYRISTLEGHSWGYGDTGTCSAWGRGGVKKGQRKAKSLKRTETHLLLQLCIFLLGMNQIEDDVERAGEDEREEETEAGQVCVALRAAKESVVGIG